MEYHNPGRLTKLIELAGGSSAAVAERDGDLMVDRITYHEREGFSRTERFIVREGRVRKLEFTFEQIPAPQLIERLKQAGFGDGDLMVDRITYDEQESQRATALQVASASSRSALRSELRARPASHSRANS